MRSWWMRSHFLSFAALPALAFASAGCERKQPEAEPSESPSIVVSKAAPTPEPAASAAPPAAAPARSRLDLGALDERKDPDRLLRFYATALAARDWSAAARAWGRDSGVTAATLKAAYDRPEVPLLEIGKATAEGAAGSLYYEAPVVLRFGPGAPAERGTLTARRVNGVGGATAEQLRWHIERSTIGAGQ